MPDIEFIQLPVPDYYGTPRKWIFYTVENDRSKVMHEFQKLNKDTRDQIRDLICKMATIKNFQSPKIRYTLRSYKFGEIKPRPHRFFFFQSIGDSIIFFDYEEKKKNSLDDEIYREINERMKRYEQAFREQMG